jgi:hypothetical protein
MIKLTVLLEDDLKGFPMELIGVLGIVGLQSLPDMVLAFPL